jgi:hypothetical protein
MRSKLVFAARQIVPNRFALCHTAAKGTRRFHISNSRIQDTMNGVLTRIAESSTEPMTLVREDAGTKRLSALSARAKKLAG